MSGSLQDDQPRLGNEEKSSDRSRHDSPRLPPFDGFATELNDLVPLNRAGNPSLALERDISTGSGELFNRGFTDNLFIVPESNGSPSPHPSPAYFRDITTRTGTSPYGPIPTRLPWSRNVRSAATPFNPSMANHGSLRKSQTPSARAMRQMWDNVSMLDRPQNARAMSRQIPEVHRTASSGDKFAGPMKELEWAEDKRFLMSLIQDMQQERQQMRENAEATLPEIEVYEARVRQLTHERDNFADALKANSLAVSQLNAQISEAQFEIQQLNRERRRRDQESADSNQALDDLQKVLTKEREEFKAAMQKSEGDLNALRQVKTVLENRTNELLQMRRKLGLRLKSMAVINKNLREQLQELRLRRPPPEDTVLPELQRRHEAAVLIQAHWRRWIQQQRYRDALFDKRVMVATSSSNFRQSKQLASRHQSALLQSQTRPSNQLRIWTGVAIATVSATVTFVLLSRFLRPKAKYD